MYKLKVASIIAGSVGWALAHAVLLMPSPCGAEPLAAPYFGKDLLDHIEVLQADKGAIDIERHDDALRVSNSNPSGFDGFVGVALEMPQLSWRQYYHWWNVRLDCVGPTLAGEVDFCIKCFDAQGNLVECVELIASDHQPGSVSKECVPVPKCYYNDTTQPVTHAHLGLAFRQWRGRLDLGKVIVSEYKLTDKDKQPFVLQDNRAEVGALPWFDPSYAKVGTVSEALRDTAHKLFAAAGIHKMRFMAVWGEHFRKKDAFRVEPAFEVEKGVYEFEKLDAYIDELDYYGHSIGVLTLWGSPGWAHTKSVADIPEYKRQSPRSHEAIDNATFPPDDWADYRRFVGKMVERYKGKIKAYEVWNEPDVWQYGLTYGYEGYFDYLKNFYQAAKQADPTSQVYAGRVSIWTVPLIDLGLPRYCDAIADHPYPGRKAGPDASPQRVEELIKCMASQDVVLPVVITEVGLGAGYPWPGPGGYHGEQAKAQAAKILVERLSRYSREVYWYTPIQAGRAYGILHHTENRYRPNPVYYTFAKHNARLDNDKAPVRAHVTLPNRAIKPGEKGEITLTAENISAQTQSIHFWPVGLIDDLGYETFAAVREYDKSLALRPGQSYCVSVPVTPTMSATGKYPVGLVVINDVANSLALAECPIWSIAGNAEVSASSCDEGTVAAVNSLFEPVWSGDIDVLRLVWDAQSEPRSEWVELDFDRSCQVSSVSVYWAANPQPRLHFPELEYDTHVVPADWRVFYRHGGRWRPVDNHTPYEVEANTYNTVEFVPVRASAIKVEAHLQPDKKAGILQVKVK